MIDTSKQYTYNSKRVRIYADGSDTFITVKFTLLKDLKDQYD